MTRDASPTPDEIVRSMPDASADDLVEMAAEWGVAMTTADVERLRQEQRARLFTAVAASPVTYDDEDDDDVTDDDGVEEPVAAAAGEPEDEAQDEPATQAAGASPTDDAPGTTAVAGAPDPTRRRRILVASRASTPEPQPAKRRPGRPRKDGNGTKPPTRDAAPRAPATNAGSGAEERAFRQAAIALVLTSGGKHARAILDDVLAKIRDAGR